MDYCNIFYFRKLNRLGGTEQFLYEIAKKYGHLDITVFYDEADPLQLKRLRRYVRCVRRKKGEKVKCQKAFFNFNIDMIDDVEADEYVFISHAIYQELGCKPPITNEKLTRFIGVSKYSSDKLNEYAEELGIKIRAEHCYNPLTIEKVDKVIHLISAARLEDNVKGGNRTLKLIEALDRYAIEHNRQYLWLIFTNSVKQRITSPNVCIMQGRTDIRPYIADSDYLVQLSNDMETYCYSINEALSYGVPCVTTPLSVLNELPIEKGMILKCDWDMSNADEIAKRIFEDKPSMVAYKPPKDRWDEILVNAPSDYKPNEMRTVKATDQWQKHRITDKDRGFIPLPDDIWKIDGDRYDELKQFEERTGIKLIYE